MKQTNAAELVPGNASAHRERVDRTQGFCRSRVNLESENLEILLVRPEIAGCNRSGTSYATLATLRESLPNEEVRDGVST